MSETENNAKIAEVEELCMKLGRAFYEGAYSKTIPELVPLVDEIAILYSELQAKPKVEPKVVEAKVCTACGEKAKEKDAFCNNCGTKLDKQEVGETKLEEVKIEEVKAFCENCGNRISEGAGFCRECGTPV